jgi:hypothetical protein
MDQPLSKIGKKGMMACRFLMKIPIKYKHQVILPSILTWDMARRGISDPLDLQPLFSWYFTKNIKDAMCWPLAFLLIIKSTHISRMVRTC